MNLTFVNPSMAYRCPKWTCLRAIQTSFLLDTLVSLIEVLCTVWFDVASVPVSLGLGRLPWRQDTDRPGERKDVSQAVFFVNGRHNEADWYYSTFTSLFVLMSKQGKGFASKALSEAERIAKDELHCSIITLNTLPAKYLSDPNWWASQGYKQPKSVPVYE